MIKRTPKLRHWLRIRYQKIILDVLGVDFCVTLSGKLLERKKSQGHPQQKDRKSQEVSVMGQKNKGGGGRFHTPDDVIRLMRFGEGAK